MYRVIGLGELLWDMLPQGPQLGGAPANLAVMARRLGDDAGLMSRIGSDAPGAQALETLREMQVDCSLIQTDLAQPTGQVTVAIENGQPSYTIHEPAAWDFLDLSEHWRKEAARADAICFGTLAQRAPCSLATIRAMVKATSRVCLRVLDVNLRAPFFNAAMVRDSLELATVVKVNDAEAPLILKLLGIAPAASGLEQARQLMDQFPQLRLVALTRGPAGSLLMSHAEWNEHPGIETRVVDTVGAGDAFTAGLIYTMLRGASLVEMNEAGNRAGSFVASRQGATPAVDEDTLNRLILEDLR